MNPFTSFSRSLPLGTVFSALEQWQPVFEVRGIRLLDLSDYTKDEQALVQERFPFVECVRRKVRSLADAYELIGQCNHIILVDTRSRTLLRPHWGAKCSSCCRCFPMSSGLSCWRFLVCMEIGWFLTGKLVFTTGMHLCAQLLKCLGLLLPERFLFYCSARLAWPSGGQG